MMILENYLSESVLGLDSVEDVQMSNEGFTLESGGGTRAIMLAETACTEIDLMLIANECASCQKISQNKLSEAYVLQENVITGALTGIKNVVVKLWARMKEVASSAKMHFTKLFNNSSFLKDAEKQLSKLTDFKDLEFEGYNIDHNALDAKKIYNEGAALAGTLYSKAESKLNGMKAGASVADTQKSVEEVKDEIEALGTDKFSKALTEQAFGCTPDKVNEDIFKKLRGGKDSKEKITWNKQQCMNAVKNLESLSNTVNGVANDIDIIHKAGIKLIESAISEAEKTNSDANDVSKPIATAKLNALKGKSQAVQTSLNFANRVCNAQLEALKENCSQSKSHILAAISQGRKNSHASTVSESTELGDGSSFFNTILEQY